MPSLRVSQITLGTWAIGGGKAWGQTARHQCLETIETALDLGITTIDTAPAYGAGKAESLVGEALRGKRSDVILATKAGLLINEHYRHCLSPASIRTQLEESLRRLGTDYIDIYFLHHPDPATPIEKSVEEFQKLKEEGIIRAVGLSNHSPAELQRALSAGPIDYIQDQLSLLNHVALSSLLPLCRENAIGFMAYAPLAAGLLTGKYRTRPSFPKGDVRKSFYHFFDEQPWENAQNVLSSLRERASRKHTHLSALAIAWVLSHKGICSCVTGARKPHQVAANSKATEIEFTAQERDALAHLAHQAQ